MPLVAAFIALGSNLGDRLGHMQSALDRLARHPIVVRQISTVYENRAIGMGEAGPFLNAVAQVETALPPMDLLDCCLEVETRLGRERTGQWAPRTIDLDIVAYGNVEVATKHLQLPHPRIAERDFVLQPLCDIAPDLRIQGRRVDELAGQVATDALTRCPFSLYIPGF